MTGWDAELPGYFSRLERAVAMTPHYDRMSPKHIAVIKVEQLQRLNKGIKCLYFGDPRPFERNSGDLWRYFLRIVRKCPLSDRSPGI
ncbi:hypothetical protein, partial [Paenibacillus sp. FSL M7-0831]|uniref:hypothetical protein n=1 Tax=Paenibacillus sp. FSL M7-0831 TaxID=2975314 RepID=UPI004046A83D